MVAQQIQPALALVLETSRCDHVVVRHKPRLSSDESLSNVKPVDVYFGRNKGVKENRKRSRNGHMFYHINAPEPPMPNPHLSPILYEGGLLAK